jgi:peptide methionine sulfoxide reductase MsrA
MEPPFDELNGVISTTSGYIGGKTKNHEKVTKVAFVD